MIPDALTHFIIIAAMIVYSIARKQDNQFIFVLFVYGAAWQMSNHLSFQDDVELFTKVFFQTSASIFLINFITRLEYTRFTGLFVASLVLTVLLYFIIAIMDKFAPPAAFNYIVETFGLINIQLIYLELLALAGISFDMGSDKGKFAKSFNANLYSSTPMVSARLSK